MILLSMVLTLLLIFSMALLFLFLVFYLLNGITPAPTAKLVQFKALNLLPGHLDGVIYELGSGWGGLAIQLAKRFPEAQVVGLENFFIPYLFSVVRLKIFRVPNLKFSLENFYSHDLSNATLVTCYLYRGAMERLKPKMEAELSPGTMVLSHTFSVPGWESEREETVENIYMTPIYLYVR